MLPGADVSEADVIASVKTHIAGYKAPKRVVFVGQVPRAPNGKADYRAAVQLATVGTAPPPGSSRCATVP